MDFDGLIFTNLVDLDYRRGHHRDPLDTADHRRIRRSQPQIISAMERTI